MKRSLSSTRGFTLLEVMIALLIVAILTAIAFPSYQDSVRKTKRSEGKAALLDLQNRMERFFIDKNSYATACIGTGCSTGTQVLANASTEHSYYTLSLSGLAANTYTLTATPTFTDTLCGALTINQAGVKGEGGTATAATQCW